MEKVLIDTRSWESSRLMNTIKSLRTICLCGKDKKPDDGSCGCNPDPNFKAVLQEYEKLVSDLYAMTAVLVEAEAAAKQGKRGMPEFQVMLISMCATALFKE